MNVCTTISNVFSITPVHFGNDNFGDLDRTNGNASKDHNSIRIYVALVSIPWTEGL